MMGPKQEGDDKLFYVGFSLSCRVPAKEARKLDTHSKARKLDTHSKEAGHPLGVAMASGCPSAASTVQVPRNH